MIYFRLYFRFNLGMFYFGINHFAKARYQFKESHDVFNSFLGADHPDTKAAEEALLIVS